jgi:hypothetical protein
MGCSFIKFPVKVGVEESIVNEHVSLQIKNQTTQKVRLDLADQSVYSPTETLVEFGFGCKFNNNNRRIRFYYQVITVVINTTTTTCNIPA